MEKQLAESKIDQIDKIEQSLFRETANFKRIRNLKKVLKEKRFIRRRASESKMAEIANERIDVEN